MSFHILFPDQSDGFNPNSIATSHESKLKVTKQAREKVDMIAGQCRIGWKGAMEIAQEMFGKSEGLSIGECGKLIEEIKRRRK